MERAYRQSTRVLGGLLALLGLVMVAVTIARGGGPLALGTVLGLLLVGVGVGRVALARAPERGRGRA